MNLSAADRDSRAARLGAALLLAACLVLLPACASGRKDRDTPPAPTGEAKQVTAASTGTAGEEEDDYDDIQEIRIADPLQPLNRVFFTFNHYLYKGVLRPVSKGYEFIVPSLLRKGIHNAYENVRFPVRFVNHALQGKFDRAGREAEKFFVNTTLGVGGLMKPSDKFPALADVPRADTGQTFAKWGIGHGFYFVIPVIGPSSARDTVGLVGDGALNPVSWVAFAFGGEAWTLAITSPDNLRSLPNQMEAYDTVTKDAVDRYLAVRSSYIQSRQAAKER